jgi:hypothetical protein
MILESLGSALIAVKIHRPVLLSSAAFGAKWLPVWRTDAE